MPPHGRIGQISLFRALNREINREIFISGRFPGDLVAILSCIIKMLAMDFPVIPEQGIAMAEQGKFLPGTGKSAGASGRALSGNGADPRVKPRVKGIRRAMIGDPEPTERNVESIGNRDRR
jgi:hypothetical protein